MVFQDPIASLNARMRVGTIVGEPLAIHEPRLSRADRNARAAQMLAAVGMGVEALERYPHEFSGGQRQRIGIARALILRPELVVADEAVSALDVSVGAQILELLDRLRRELSLTLILISHSLPVVAQLATRVSVMQAGKFVESGTADQVLQFPPASIPTQALIAARYRKYPSKKGGGNGFVMGPLSGIKTPRRAHAPGQESRASRGTPAR